MMPVDEIGHGDACVATRPERPWLVLGDAPRDLGCLSGEIEALNRGHVSRNRILPENSGKCAFTRLERRDSLMTSGACLCHCAAHKSTRICSRAASFRS